MRSTLFAGIAAVLLASVANAAADPTIPTKRKAAVQQAMKHHIDKHLVDGRYVIFDAVDGQLLRLELKKLHAGVVRKAEFYVSCADFTDARGGIVDVDFLVGQVEDGFHVLEVWFTRRVARNVRITSRIWIPRPTVEPRREG